MPPADQQPADPNPRSEAQQVAKVLDDHRRQVLAYIERNLGRKLRTKVDAEDIWQEVAMQALRYSSKILEEGRDPLGWLCQLAEQRIIDAHRKHFGSQKRDAGREVALGQGKESQQGLIDLLVASITSPSQAFSRNQREERLHQALAELSTDGREALRLRYVEGLSTREIGKQIGKSDGAIRVLLSRMLARLQQLLGEGSTGSSR